MVPLEHGMDGEFKFMEIKHKKSLFLLSINLVLLISNELNAQIERKIIPSNNIEIVEVNSSEIIVINEEENLSKKNNSKKPLLYKKVDVSKIIIPSQNRTIETNLRKLNSNFERDSQYNSLELETNQFIEIIGVDKRPKLFNGSLLIKFNNMPNLEAYAESNNLLLIKNLSDINVGVFKLKNILDIQIKLDNLQNDNNIVTIDLDTIDPFLKPK